jgi:hypothetical protein
MMHTLWGAGAGCAIENAGAGGRRYAYSVQPSVQSIRPWARFFSRIVVLFGLLLCGQSSPAYSVLTHEQVVDLLWKAQIRPMLMARFPGATEDEIRQAHAYAYGGSLIQDIGYYPFGNRFFSDLVHYVRSGDFVTNLITEADESNDIDQYAFALGALAHYASDIAGHPSVNIAVGETFPKLKLKYGPSVTYADNPTAHIRTEFGFDVVQVARDRFTSQAFHDFIGFEVSKPLLENAFMKTYGLPLHDAFPNLDLAIGSFRYSVSRLIPRMTKVAIAMKKDEILKEDPTMTRKRFLYHLKASEYRHEWGRTYQRPGFGDRMLAFFLNILPKVGPLKALDFKMPTPTTEDLYMKSVLASADHYGDDLKEVGNRSLALDNRDFDTGSETKAGEYSLTDDTYADLLEKLAEEHFAQVTPELQANVKAYYRDPAPPAFAAKKPGKWRKTLANLAAIEALPMVQGQSLASR